jgi:solute carrier family 25 citrate transporter 1
MKRYSTKQIQSRLAEWDETLEGSDKGERTRPESSMATVRKMPKILETSNDFPSVIWTGERDPKEDNKTYYHEGTRSEPALSEALRQRLVAPTAGFISAGLEISIVWPSEYAKVQLQLNRADKSFNIFSHMRERGFGIYRGLTPMLIGAPVQGFLRFGSLDYFTNLLRDEETGKTGRASGLLAGFTAGILEAIFVVTPMETVKTRLIDSGKGLADGVRYVLEKDGISGLYKGLFATMAKSASNQALRFMIFNEYKRCIIGDRPLHELTTGESLVGGMTAGCMGALGNTPFDTVKTRMQGLESSRYSGVMHCAQCMVKEEGVLSLWKGLLPRMGRVVPGQGIIFASYESISNAIRTQIL